MDAEMIHAPAALETGDIRALGRQVEGYVAAAGQGLWERRHARLLDAYQRVGEMAYGAYLELLFRPLHRLARQSGLGLAPRFPGRFEISREWGAEEDRQRWMWSAVAAPGGAPLGTLVFQVHHDHTGFRLPRPVGVLALAEAGDEAVIAALSRRSPEFAAAREASVEIAEYLQSLAAREE